MKDWRNLETAPNSEGGREYNRVIVENLSEFLDAYLARHSNWPTPYDILKRLEDRVMYENEVDGPVWIPVGSQSVMFSKERHYVDEKDRRTVVYSYNPIG